MKETGTIVGLTDEEVLSSRSKHGENVLTPPEKASLWSQFIEKFKDPIIRILLVALLLSFGVSIYQMTAEGESATALLEPFGILIAVLLATLVGFFFEVSANRKFDILNQVNNDVPVQVIRNGHLTEIPKRDVVVGDIVSLNTGDEIPADGELLESVSLQVNESTLTGEPIVAKTTVEADFDSEATYPSNHVTNGTTVVDGHGLMRVTQVGDATEYGKVYEGSQIDNHTQTPLDRQLERLAGIISKASYIIAAIVVVARMTIYFLGDNPTDWIHLGSYSLSTLMIAVTLIVVAVPEGLPMSVTLSLAMSMKRMLATNNLVRKMHACETLGATSVICTDKTGTLTQNQMQIYRTNFWKLGDASLTESVSGRMIAEAIAVNSTANLDIDESGKARVLGNPTEGALLLWLRKQELEYMALRAEVPVVAQLTFSTERKYMATVVDSPAAGKRILYVKGAPEILMSVCDVVETDKGDLPIADCRSEIESLLLTYQNQAMRTLGFAYAEADDSLPYFVDGRINPAIRLRMIGIAAISDPVRADVPAAIRLSRATLRNIHENLFWAFIYNIIGIPLAAGVWIPLFGWKLNPMFGAAAMSLSSFCVVTNALRLNLFRMHDASKDKRIKNEIPKEDLNMTTEQGMVKTMTIEGMMCGHCEARVKKTLEAIEGVASAEVSHEKGTAVVTLTAPVSDNVLKTAVEAQDYTVKGIQ